MEVKFYLSKDKEQFTTVKFENCNLNTIHKLAFDFIKKRAKRFVSVFGYEIL